MTDAQMTPELARELLDGATAGPWQADGAFTQDGCAVRIAMPDKNGVPMQTVAEAFYQQSDDEVYDGERRISWKEAEKNARLIAAAPDLARAYLAEHEARVAAEAAQALMTEKAAATAYRVCAETRHVTLGRQTEEAIRRLAPEAGVAELAKLRATYDDLYADAIADAKSDAQEFEGDLWKAIRAILDDLGYDWSGDAQYEGVTADDAAQFIRDAMDGETRRAETAEAEAATLRTRLAEAEGKVAALTDFVKDFATAKIDALRYSPPHGASPEDEPDPVVDAETVWAWQSDANAALAAVKEAEHG